MRERCRHANGFIPIEEEKKRRNSESEHESTVVWYQSHGHTHEDKCVSEEVGCHVETCGHSLYVDGNPSSATGDLYEGVTDGHGVEEAVVYNTLGPRHAIWYTGSNVVVVVVVVVVVIVVVVEGMHDGSHACCEDDGQSFCVFVMAGGHEEPDGSSSQRVHCIV